MKSFSFALTLLLGTLLSFDLAFASPAAAGLEARYRTECPITTVTITTTRRHRTITSTITTRPTDCPTATSSTVSSTPTCDACSSCATPAGVTVTRTLNWEDIDGTLASQVPIPDHYNDFNVYNPDKNKVYRSGPPPVSVGNGSQVLYANDGSFGLGAEGFVLILKSFWVFTFLDGVSSATIRVIGPGYNGFTTVITQDRQFVQIIAPTTQSNTALGFFIEVFAGNTVGGARLPAYIDDIVYERILYPASCCQNALLAQATKFDFSDLPSGYPALTPYRGFNFPDGWFQATLPTPNDYPSAGTVLRHTAKSGTFTSATGNPFTLLRIAIYIPPHKTPVVPGSTYQYWITIDGLDFNGNTVDFGWQVPAVVFGNEVVKIDVAGDFLNGNAGGPTGFFAATGGFKNIYGVRIQVDERAFNGPNIPREFWIDDIVFAQETCAFV